MSHRDSEKARVTFRDVAVCFSEEEWKLLHKCQKGLYRNVMMEIHQALISLGYRIINPEILLRVTKGEETYIWDPQDPGKGAAINDPTLSCCPAINPDILLRIHDEEAVYCRDLRTSEEAEISKSPSTAKEHVTSFIIKEEDETCSLDDQDAERGDISNNPVGSGHEDRYKMWNKEICTETLKLGEVLSSKDKKKILQHALKREMGKRPKKSQRMKRSQVVNKPTQSTESKNGVRISENYSEQQNAQTGAGRYTCTECGESFICNSILTNHLNTHTGEKPYMCSECGKCFKDSSALLAHQRIHTGVKPYICSDCGKCFSRSSTLKNHQQIHTGLRPYKCSECGKCFSRSSSLITHQQIHTGVKPYKCSDCGTCFSQSSSLISHQRIHTGVKPYKCSDCGKCFSRISALITHQRIHTGAKPYTCSDCGKCFSHSSSLITHQRIHTGVKPYKCSECGKCFSRSSALITHQRIHTGVKPYTCSECGKCFSRSSHLSTHQKIHTARDKVPNITVLETTMNWTTEG